ncbi:cation:proton antiporter [Actinosynnema sp. NPDC051121]
MVELLVVLVAGIVVIAAAAVIGPRLGVAAPLVLVAIGVGASFLPAFESLHVEPEWILEGVFPPLLYSAAVSMPAMNFRRDFGAIGGLSVLLVIGNSLVLGWFFTLVIPGLGFAWGVALGAVVSPTDAVATSIIRRTSVSKRVVALLDGEGLLNDATALVLLRTAIVATAASFSFLNAVAAFAHAVAVAVVIGGFVGWLNLAARRRVTDAPVNTVLSFTAPFVASVPAELLGGSGLVAAVVAGLVTGVHAPRVLSAQHRLSDWQNWRTVELVLEGAVFLTMGLQIEPIVANVERDHAGSGRAVLVAAVALVLTLLVRAAFVAPLLGLLARRSRRGERLQPRLRSVHERLTTAGGRPRQVSEQRLERFAVRVRKMIADIDYFRREPLGWRDGTAVVWAGMRGAVTVAAAQTLPDDTPRRSVLVLVAFAVAVISLAVQGSTIGPLIRRLTRDQDADDARAKAERSQLVDLMRAAAATVPKVPRPEGEPTTAEIDARRRRLLAVFAAQRSALLDARDEGTFDADVLASALANLDASEIAVQMRAGTPRTHE